MKNMIISLIKTLNYKLLEYIQLNKYTIINKFIITKFVFSTILVKKLKNI